MHEISWGDAPTWIASVGTVGALIAAFIQIGTERSRRHAREPEDRAEARLAQARLVSAVVGPTEPAPPDPELDLTNDAVRLIRGRIGVDLLNTSQEPVYTLFVCLVFIQGAAPMTTGCSSKS